MNLSETLMLTLSNSLSFLRIPLAFLFLIENSSLRFFAIIIAMFTDSIDGYLARRSQTVSRFGAILDPFADKFFVYFALSILLFEGKLELFQVITMVSRDIAVLLFAFCLIFFHSVKSMEIRSFRAGKIFTAFQFVVLIALVLNLKVPVSCFYVFSILAIAAFFELIMPVYKVKV